MKWIPLNDLYFCTFMQALNKLNIISEIYLSGILFSPSPWHGRWSPYFAIRGQDSIPGGVRNFNLYPGTGCVSFFFVLSCVASGGGPDVLTTYSERSALVYLSSGLVYNLLLPYRHLTHEHLCCMSLRMYVLHSGRIINRERKKGLLFIPCIV